MNEDQLMLLGEIKAQLSAVGKQLENMDARLGTMEQRVRELEVGAAKYGFVAGGVISIAIALGDEIVKGWLKSGAR